MRNPHPSAPKRPARYCLRFRGVSGGFYVQVWCERYAAKAAIVAMLGPVRRWQWQSHTMATGRHGITVECDALERLADFTPDDEESTWAIPAPYDGEISQFIKKAIAR